MLSLSSSLIFFINQHETTSCLVIVLLSIYLYCKLISLRDSQSVLMRRWKSVNIYILIYYPKHIVPLVCHSMFTMLSIYQCSSDGWVSCDGTCPRTPLEGAIVDFLSTTMYVIYVVGSPWQINFSALLTRSGEHLKHELLKVS